MSRIKMTLQRGQVSRQATIVAGSAEAQADMISLNIDQSRMSRTDALILLGELAATIIRAPWPPKTDDGTSPGPDLQPLTLSSTQKTVDDGADAIAISGTTTGSTITVTRGAHPTGMILSSAARSLYGTPTQPGTYEFDLTERLGSASRTTTVTVTVLAWLKFSQALVSKNEGAAGETTVFDLVFQRSHALGGAIGVAWTFAPGQTSPDDYAGGAYPVPAPIALGATALTGAISIAVKGDATVEPDEDFTAGLVAPTGYILIAPASCTGRIINDDSGNPEIVLEQNPAPQQKTAADSADTGTLPTTVADNFLEVDAISGGYYTLYDVGSDATGQNFNRVVVQDGSIIFRQYNGGSQGPESGTITPSPALTGRVRFAQKGNSVAVFTGSAGNLVKVAERGMPGGGTYVRAQRQFGGQNTGIVYGGDNIPMALGAVALNGDLTLSGTLQYTGSPDTYEVILTDTAGTVLVDWTPVILQSATKGQVSWKTRTPYPASARGKGVQWRIRQRNLPTVISAVQVLTIADPRMTFGVNLTMHTEWYGNVVFRSHFAGWRLRDAYDASPQMDRKGNALEVARSSSSPPFGFVMPPRVSGQRMRARWKGVANMKIEAGPHASMQSPQNGSGGGYTWRDFNYNFEPIYQIQPLTRDDTNLSVFILDSGTGTGSDWPTDFECYPINADGSPVSTGRFDTSFLADTDLYAAKGGPAPFRTMDWQGMSGNAGRVFDVSDIAAAGERAPNGTVSIPDILEFHRLKGKRPRIHIPLLATEAYIRAVARLVRDWCVANVLGALFELQNEVWNSGQGAWNVARQKGAEKWGGAADNDNAMRWHNFRFNEVMAMVRQEFAAVSGATAYLTRVIAGQCDSPGNKAVFCEGRTGDLRAIDECERIDIAPYVGAERANDINTGSQNGDLAEYQRRILAHMVEQHANAKVWQQYAFANGKAFGCYEGGIENSYGNQALVRAHRLSPLHGEAVKAILDHWQTNIGGFYSWYYDNNFIWGLKNHATQPTAANSDNLPIAYGYNAWVAKMAEVAAA